MASSLAGLTATAVSYPIDTLHKHRIKNPIQTSRDLLANAWKQHGSNFIRKFAYRGFSVSLFRMPFTMGATNVAIHLADNLHEGSKKI